MYDKPSAAAGRSVKQGAIGAASLRDLVTRLSRPRAVWLLAPSFERFSLRGGGDFANRVLSAVRQAFGGHAEERDVQERRTWDPRDADILSANDGAWRNPVPEKDCA